MDDAKKQIQALIKSASEVSKADDAMKFAQAALNAANALCALKIAGQETKP